VAADASADPGFSGGEVKPFAATRIAGALHRRDGIFVPENDGSRATMLLPLVSPRGHDLGWVGLTLPGHVAPPEPAVVRAQVDDLAATL